MAVSMGMGGGIPKVFLPLGIGWVSLIDWVRGLIQGAPTPSAEDIAAAKSFSVGAGVSWDSSWDDTVLSEREIEGLTPKRIIESTNGVPFVGGGGWYA